jgi:hypothetical protein
MSFLQNILRVCATSWFLAALGSLGCATTSPVLVEPRVPDRGEVRGQVGAAALAPVGGDRSALADARASLSSASGSTPATDRGTAVALAARPGVAPFVRGVVGILPEVEATLRYGARDVSVGARWTFVDVRGEQGSAATISVGGDARALLRGRLEGGVLDGVDVGSSHGYGGTIPIVAAWQSDAGLLLAYAAALGGYDGIAGSLSYSGVEGSEDAFVRRFYATGLLGLGIGFRRVHVVMELGVERDWIHASFGARDVDVRLWSLAPAGCLSVRF